MHSATKTKPWRLSIYEWLVDDPEKTLDLMCCDGFFSKNAFTTPEMVMQFPVFCHQSEFFNGTCFSLAALFKKMPWNLDCLPHPEKHSMGSLFTFFSQTINPILCDKAWRDFSRFVLSCNSHDVWLLENVSVTVIMMEKQGHYIQTCWAGRWAPLNRYLKSLLAAQVPSNNVTNLKSQVQVRDLLATIKNKTVTNQCTVASTYSSNPYSTTKLERRCSYATLRLNICSDQAQ